MKITLNDIGDYVAFMYPALETENRNKKMDEVRDDFDEYCGEKEVVLLHRDSSGKLDGVLFLLKLQEGVFAAANVRIAPEVDEPVYSWLLREAVIESKARGGTRLQSRTISGPLEPGRRRALETTGFKPGAKRVEFRRELDSLPDDGGSPLAWSPAGELNEEEFRRIGAILKRAGEGDPDFGPDEDTVELLRGYLDERGLSGGADCIHLGQLDGETAAIVIAQVQASDGWSRITYMGLLPEFRGKGLGRWVHRHGFAMMKAQGGKLYHGGTLEKNESMVRMFRLHECAPYRDMQEWALIL